MQPNQQQPYPQQVPPQNQYDFTANNQMPQQQPQPQQPSQPAFDLDKFKEDVVKDLAEAVQGMQPQQPNQQQPQQQPDAAKKYNEWGAPDQPGTVFGDVAQLVEQKFQEREQQQQQIAEQAKTQEQKNQEWIDKNINDLRSAGYLPPVANQFDANDVGKRAENELLGYAIQLGTTNLAAAAKELADHHQRGEFYDYNSKQFVKTGQADQPQQPNIFGQPGMPDQQFPQQYPQQQVAPQYPQAPAYPYPVGPQNPYMPSPTPQYPAGFNAPVATGNNFMGVTGQAPNVRDIRRMSYDDLLDTFNRTQ